MLTFQGPLIVITLMIFMYLRVCPAVSDNIDLYLTVYPLVCDFDKIYLRVCPPVSDNDDLYLSVCTLVSDYDNLYLRMCPRVSDNYDLPLRVHPP